MTKVLELFGHSTAAPTNRPWPEIIGSQECPFTTSKCIKVRKSDPSTSIGTCTVAYGKGDAPVIICPLRLLERGQVFTDAIHLLTVHEPGNELHVVPEISIPGGSVDFFLASARDGKVKDFVGIEFQTLDTTGTVWPARQSFLQSKGMKVSEPSPAAGKGYGMNWKMTAKTILVQLHHKVATFEHINKKLVLAVQDRLLAYLRGEFTFDHVSDARLGDAMHIHSYSLSLREDSTFRLALAERLSTDEAGIARCLGLQAEAKIELETVIAQLETRISGHTLLRIA